MPGEMAEWKRLPCRAEVSGQGTWPSTEKTYDAAGDSVP